MAIGDGIVTIPLTQAYPAPVTAHQMDAPPVVADGLSPQTVTVAYLDFVTPNGVPKAVTTVQATMPPGLTLVDVLPVDPLLTTRWRLRAYGGAVGRVYPVSLLVDGLFVVQLSVVLHAPVTAKPKYINNIAVVDGVTRYTLEASDGNLLQSEYPLP